MIEPEATEPVERNIIPGERASLDRRDDEARPDVRAFSAFFDRAIRARRSRGPWLQSVLLAATLLTTTVFGYALVQSFAAGHGLDVDWVVDGYIRLAHGNRGILSGVAFSLPLIAILLAHEGGHSAAAMRSNVDASLPYFLPFPSLFGTLGAFIRIRSPIYSRKNLFDIGIAGPIAGFVTLLPFLAVGLSLSKTVTVVADPGAFAFGTPLLLRLAEWIWFPGVPASSIALHPTAMAAWVGLFSTALNLLPVGQLDGGHILYAALGERWHRAVSNTVVGLLLLAGYFYKGWFVWAVLLFFLGRRHPLIYDETRLDRSRLAMSVGALLLFILAVSIVPVSSQ